MPKNLPPRRRYLAIADAIENAIRNGVLKAGTRLPPHRDLAFQIGISVSTASKAYQEAIQRRLIVSEVGRGTYVLAPSAILRNAPIVRAAGREVIDMSYNCPVLLPQILSIVAAQMKSISEGDRLSRLLQYHRPYLGLEEHRNACASWLSYLGLRADPRNIVVCSGAQHGLALVLGAVTRPGSIVLTETLAEPVLQFVCTYRGLNLRGVAIDDEGILPDAFESACRNGNVSALCCMPTHHSPTLAMMPESRRKEISRIAEAFGVAIIENEVYRPFVSNPLPPIATISPASTYFITSFSKFLAPGLRIGMVVAPDGLAESLIPSLGATSWMAPLISAELAMNMVNARTAERMADLQRKEFARRHDIAAEILKKFHFTALKSSMHLWLSVPEPWRAESFTKEARARGVAVASAESFATSRAPVPQSIRISLGGTLSRGDIKEGLGILAELLESSPSSSVHF